MEPSPGYPLGHDDAFGMVTQSAMAEVGNDLVGCFSRSPPREGLGASDLIPKRQMRQPAFIRGAAALRRRLARFLMVASFSMRIFQGSRFWTARRMWRANGRG